MTRRADIAAILLGLLGALLLTCPTLARRWAARLGVSQ